MANGFQINALRRQVKNLTEENETLRRKLDECCRFKGCDEEEPDSHRRPKNKNVKGYK